eukprot:m.680210 g.680210  ORF g.680210 m.680210 type:complete len:207 (+) comp58591_c0_seq5:393-1013(+)
MVLHLAVRQCVLPVHPQERTRCWQCLMKRSLRVHRHHPCTTSHRFLKGSRGHPRVRQQSQKHVVFVQSSLSRSIVLGIIAILFTPSHCGPLPGVNSTISAAPVIRDKAAELKKLVPTSLLVRRPQPAKKPVVPRLHSTFASTTPATPGNAASSSASSVPFSTAPSGAPTPAVAVQPSVTSQAAPASAASSKDLAYQQFMAELGGLL